MKNERYILLLPILCLIFSGCGVCSKIVEIHKTDTIKIAAPLVRDTTFIFEKSRDTIRNEFSTIYRYGDTIRLYYIERPCTTYISKTEIQPTRHTKETRQERPFYEKLTLWDKLIFILALAIIFVFILRYAGAGRS